MHAKGGLVYLAPLEQAYIYPITVLVQKGD